MCRMIALLPMLLAVVICENTQVLQTNINLQNVDSESATTDRISAITNDSTEISPIIMRPAPQSEISSNLQNLAPISQQALDAIPLIREANSQYQYQINSRYEEKTRPQYIDSPKPIRVYIIPQLNEQLPTTNSVYQLNDNSEVQVQGKGQRRIASNILMNKIRPQIKNNLSNQNGINDLSQLRNQNRVNSQQLQSTNQVNSQLEQLNEVNSQIDHNRMNSQQLEQNVNQNRINSKPESIVSNIMNQNGVNNRNENTVNVNQIDLNLSNVLNQNGINSPQIEPLQSNNNNRMNTRTENIVNLNADNTSNQNQMNYRNQPRNPENRMNSQLYRMNEETMMNNPTPYGQDRSETFLEHGNGESTPESSSYLYKRMYV